MRQIELNESELEYVRRLRVGERFKLYGFVEARVVPIHAGSLTKHCADCVAGDCVMYNRNRCPLLLAVWLTAGRMGSRCTLSGYKPSFFLSQLVGRGDYRGEGGEIPFSPFLHFF